MLKTNLSILKIKTIFGHDILSNGQQPRRASANADLSSNYCQLDLRNNPMKS